MSKTVTALIGHKILLRRKSRGISQTDLAARARISQAHLSNIEKGKRVLTVEVVATLAGLLGCQMADLMPVLPSRHGAVALCQQERLL
jgi:transcriptional regulator with XRE-family HTH domain